jgi:hypothetical protein
VAITAVCHMASDEVSRTPALERRLLLLRPPGADSFIELQLFYKLLRNIDTEFTTLITVAAAGDTYIVILIQSRPMVDG